MNHVGHGEHTDDDGHHQTEEREQGTVGFNLVGPGEGQNLKGQEEEREIVEHGRFFELVPVFILLDVDLTNPNPEK